MRAQGPLCAAGQCCWCCRVHQHSQGVSRLLTAADGPLCPLMQLAAAGGSGKRSALGRPGSPPLAAPLPLTEAGACPAALVLLLWSQMPCWLLLPGCPLLSEVPALHGPLQAHQVMMSSCINLRVASHAASTHKLHKRWESLRHPAAARMCCLRSVHPTVCGHPCCYTCSLSGSV
jgi:hypothetical protein